MVHVYKEGLEVKLRRRLCSLEKLSSSWSGFEERSMIEVRAGSWAMAQLLMPVHRDGFMDTVTVVPFARPERRALTR